MSMDMVEDGDGEQPLAIYPQRTAGGEGVELVVANGGAKSIQALTPDQAVSWVQILAPSLVLGLTTRKEGEGLAIIINTVAGEVALPVTEEERRALVQAFMTSDERRAFYGAVFARQAPPTVLRQGKIVRNVVRDAHGRITKLIDEDASEPS